MPVRKRQQGYGIPGDVSAVQRGCKRSQAQSRRSWLLKSFFGPPVQRAPWASMMPTSSRGMVTRGLRRLSQAIGRRRMLVSGSIRLAIGTQRFACAGWDPYWRPSLVGAGQGPPGFEDIAGIGIGCREHLLIGTPTRNVERFPPASCEVIRDDQIFVDFHRDRECLRVSIASKGNQKRDNPSLKVYWLP
jgi:hypothetical protein